MENGGQRSSLPTAVAEQGGPPLPSEETDFPEGLGRESEQCGRAGPWRLPASAVFV